MSNKLKDIFKYSSINPESIIIKNKKEQSKEYFIALKKAKLILLHSGRESWEELIIFKITKKGCNKSFQEILVRENELEDYSRTKLTNRILFYCNKEANNG